VADVKSSTTKEFLTLAFGQGAFKLDQDTKDNVKNFIQTNEQYQDGKIEIRAFASSTVGSISEARRIAYYRAMTVRTQLVEEGYLPNQLVTKVIVSSLEEEEDLVRIYARP
jgi:outer membrane protein OmpA-like peptidoglycan-associated protein